MFGSFLIAAEPEVDAKSEKKAAQIQDLRRRLSNDWDSVSMALVLDCSCTGRHARGIRITKKGDAYWAAGWTEVNGEEKSQIPAELLREDLAPLLIQVEADYVAAVHSLDPEEKVGPRPNPESREFRGWVESVTAAGGSPFMGDRISLEVAVAVNGTTTTFAEHYSVADSAKFGDWLERFKP